MKRVISRLVSLSVFVGMVFNNGVGAVNGLFENSGEDKHVSNYKLKMEVSSLKEKNKKLEERIDKIEQEQKQTKEDFDNHKKKDYHGYGFKDGGWWKNVASRLAAELVFIPIGAAFAISALGIGLAR